MTEPSAADVIREHGSIVLSKPGSYGEPTGRVRVFEDALSESEREAMWREHGAPVATGYMSEHRQWLVEEPGEEPSE